jgi:hypothetical protein
MAGRVPKGAFTPKRKVSASRKAAFPAFNTCISLTGILVQQKIPIRLLVRHWQTDSPHQTWWHSPNKRGGYVSGLQLQPVALPQRARRCGAQAQQQG